MWWIIFVIIGFIVLVVALTSAQEKRKENKGDEAFLTSGYKVTRKIGDLYLDEANKKWAVLNYIGNVNIHDYSDIADFELFEDGCSYKPQGGVLRAATGGVLFGGVGAVVGAGTAKQAQTIRSMYFDIYLKNGQCERLQIISAETKVDSVTYNLSKQIAGTTTATLMAIRNETNSTSEPQDVSPSSADEIMKFKQLLDSGAITQEEFEQKKKQLLDL